MRRLAYYGKRISFTQFHIYSLFTLFYASLGRVIYTVKEDDKEVTTIVSSSDPSSTVINDDIIFEEMPTLSKISELDRGRCLPDIEV